MTTVFKGIIALLLPAAAAIAAGVTIPSTDGLLTIDGRVDESAWQNALKLPLESPEFDTALPSGGEMRVMVRGAYVCVSARVPENTRLVARSTGVDPEWWREDVLAWTFAFRAFATSVKVTVNPIGAYRVDVASAREPLPKPKVLAAAAILPEGWSAEAAIPISAIGAIGFLSGERIRSPRPDAPELRWNWPGANDGIAYRLPEGNPNVRAPAVAASDWRQAASPAAPDAGEILNELSEIPSRVWSAFERKKLGIAEMWEKALRARVLTAALDEQREWEKVTTVAKWEKFREPRLAALKASLGTFPERTPLRAAITRRMDYGDGFVVENVLYESRPGLVVTANLYLPPKPEGRIPAVVVVHSHHAPKVQWELQDLGMTWARAGAAVLVMDQLGAGERLQSQAWARESYYSRYALGTQLYLAGESLMKWMVWDLMRGIDLLLERPYIDPKRIVMLGAVAGGGDPAAVVAALDNRVAAVLPFNFGESGPEEHYTEGSRPYDFATADPGWGSWESTRNLRQSIAGQFFPWFICASRAPRPFVFSFEMGWPERIEKEPAWARYKTVYKLYGRRGNLDQVEGFGPFPGPGEVTNVGVYHLKQIYPILKRWLDVPVPSSAYHSGRPEADLMCLTPQATAERRPKTAAEIALGLARSRLDAARKRRAALSSAESLRRLRDSLKEKLGDIEPNRAAAARVLWTKRVGEYSAEGVVLEAAGIQIPLIFVQPAAEQSSRRPVVVALAQSGKEAFLTARRGDITALLKRGIAVCLADVRGTGETAARNSTALAATELMLGNTAMGARLKDTRTVIAYVRRRAGIDAARMALWGDSFAEVNPRGFMLDQSVHQRPGPQPIHQADPLGSLLALLGALYEPDIKAAAGRGGLASYLSVLEDRFTYVPQEVAVPGILETTDANDIVAALAVRPVLLAALVDGRNRPLTPAESQAHFETAAAAYGTARSQLVVRHRGTPAGIGIWIANQLADSAASGLPD